MPSSRDEAPPGRTPAGAATPTVVGGSPAPGPPAVEGDLIEIRGLRAFGHHGVYDRERRDGQVFVVDATLAVDLRRAGRSDDLADTVHYGDLSERLAQAVGETRFDLIEALAEHLAALVLQHPGVASVRIRVAKPAAPLQVDVEQVAVVVTRP